GRRQAHRGRDRDVFQSAQQQRDVSVVKIAVLQAESDVVVAGCRELLGPDDGGAHHPSAPHLVLGGQRVLQSPRRHATIAILMRSGAGRQASSNAPCTSSTPKVWVTYAGSNSGCARANSLAEHSTRRRSNVTPDLSVRLLRSMVRMLIG